MATLNNPIWIMSSAFEKQDLSEIIQHTLQIGAQGIDLCVFRREGTRKDHVATHLDYEDFNLEDAHRIIEQFNTSELKLSIGAFENLIGGDEKEQIKNQDHLLKLIRMAHLLGGDENDVKVGTFVGYDHELGILDRGFQRNLDKYKKVFEPIVKYAEDLGVTILYENCPMEGWRKASGSTFTFNNLPGVLAARKLMYELIPSRSHGEIYDPSHDVWQMIDPIDVVKETDFTRVHRIHVKATRNKQYKARTYWGSMYPMQEVDAELADKAGIPIPQHDWDRHHYEAMLPGFGGSDSMDWRGFVDIIKEKGFTGPFEIENEALLSKDTGNLGAITQGFKSCLMFLMPMLWPLGQNGYEYEKADYEPLEILTKKDIPVTSMKQLQE